MAKAKENKVASSVAIDEVNKWLDFKQVSNTEREENTDSIKKLIDEVQSGNLSIDDKFNLTYNLKFPIGSDQSIQQLVFKPRLTVDEFKNKCGGLKPGDVDGKMCAYAAALTDNNRSLLLGLDTKDYSVVQSIVIFFI